MEQRALLIPTLRDFEKRAQERPCTRRGLESLEGEFEEALRKARIQGVGGAAGAGAPGDTLETLKAADAVRVALRRGVVAHDRARSDISRVQELVARGHMREAVIESVKMRNLVGEFSDLSLDFVAEAQAKNQRRHRRLITSAVLLAAGILVAAIVIEILRRVTPH